MRDLLVTAIVFGTLPFILTRPYVGILLWSWIGYMSPHRLGWGFAYSFPFAQVAGIVTLISVLISNKKINFFWAPIIGWLLFFNIWMLITTFFSLQPEESWVQWEKVTKIQLITFLTLWIFDDPKKVQGLVWVIVLSIGFYGVKGGIFTLTTGGESHVLGPSGTFISGNTEIGLALVMILPLFWYIYLNTTKAWARFAILAATILIAIAILGTHSRGALLAIIACAGFLWLKSRKKAVLVVAMIALVPFLFLFMPETWHDRMSTIQEYEQDASAQGRLQAWELGLRLAASRPLGGGFECFNKDNYDRFAPGIVEAGTGGYHDAHSIYFEVLGEHGFIGLGIFLILLFLSWRTSGKIMTLTKHSSTNKWAYDLASMIQVSMVGYMVGGAFLGLAYFDLIYHLMVILTVVLRIVEQQSKLEYAGKQQLSFQ